MRFRKIPSVAHGVADGSVCTMRLSATKMRWATRNSFHIPSMLQTYLLLGSWLCRARSSLFFCLSILFLSTPEDCEVWVPFASDGHVRNGIRASGRRSRVISWLPARVEILNCFPDGHQILVIGSVTIIGQIIGRSQMHSKRPCPFDTEPS